MRRYELGMSLDYCSDWGVPEAVREFFQNALDEQTANPENKMYFEYKDNKLYIGNRLSKLNAESLLLGVSSKRGNDNLIGTHGEGYKVATVVLARNGVTVTVYNNEREVWTSKVVKSRRYNADICVFDVEKKIFKQDNNLLFVLDGITEEMYQGVVDSNLHLQEDIGETKESDCGRLLMDEKYKGKIFVSGLYVCTRSQFDFGYDFAPNMIRLDRDRGLIDSFDLNFATSKLLAGTRDSEFLASISGKHDCQFMSTYMRDTDLGSNVGRIVYDRYVEDYGDDFVPVSNMNTFNEIHRRGGNPVLCNSSEYELMKPFAKDFVEENMDLQARYELWKSDASVYLPNRLVKEIDEIWELSMKTKE